MNSSLLQRGRTTTVVAPGGRSANARRAGDASSSEAPASATRSRRRRRLGLVAGAVALTAVLAGCGPAANWVPDLNGDGHIDQTEVAHQTEVIQQIAANIDAQRRAVQNHPFLTCVRAHESDRGPAPHINGYAAKNPSSSASGAYQFLDSTWRNVSASPATPATAVPLTPPGTSRMPSPSGSSSTAGAVPGTAPAAESGTAPAAESGTARLQPGTARLLSRMT